MDLSRLIVALAATFWVIAALGEPEWIRQPTRTVDSGYIVYVGHGEEKDPEGARFRAEAAALEDLANECSFAPKGARVEETYQAPAEGGESQAYVKVGISFDDCEKAQRAVTPEEIRNLANLEMTDELKRYHALIDPPAIPPPPPPPEGTGEATGNAASGFAVNVPSDPGTGAPSLVEPSTAYGSPPLDWNTPAWTTSVVIANPWQYYLWRRRVYFAKAWVILSPPFLFAAGTPQRATFVRSLGGVSREARVFLRSSPLIRSQPVPWSVARATPAAVALQTESPFGTPRAGPRARRAAATARAFSPHPPPRSHSRPQSYSARVPAERPHFASASRPAFRRMPAIPKGLGGAAHVLHVAPRRFHRGH